tara:strand:+ start:3101 stop:3328 length:228 start_codon:yes stop_codon:yes gene_type:complete
MKNIILSNDLPIRRMRRVRRNIISQKTIIIQHSFTQETLKQVKNTNVKYAWNLLIEAMRKYTVQKIKLISSMNIV